MHPRIGIGVFGLALAALAPAAAGHAEEAAKPEPETFIANAMSLSGGGGPNTGRLRMYVKRWTTDEERGDLLRVLAEQGSRKLAEALQDEKPLGTISFSNTLGYDLRYARTTEHEGKRRIVLGTDRPILGAEVMNNTRSLDNAVTLIFLELDAEGNGAGKMLVGAELVLDAEKRDLTIESLATNPIELTKVRKD